MKSRATTEVIAAALEAVEAGRIKSTDDLPYHHATAKQNLPVRCSLPAAWYLGRNPRNSVVFATYNDKYAVDVGSGGDVKTMIQSPLYRHVFPDLELRYGGADQRPIDASSSGGDMCSALRRA